MIDPQDVTACLVTRGDQPYMMSRITESLIFGEVVVWDNSVETDWKCAGRYMATARASNNIVYFQDDDVIVPESTQRALLASYEPGVMVANYGHGENDGGYGDLPLVCGGAIVDRWVPWLSISRYLIDWPLDDAFAYEADFVVGVLYHRWRHVQEPFEINLNVAQHPSRLCNQPWQADLKLELTERARAIRDGERVAA